MIIVDTKKMSFPDQYKESIRLMHVRIYLNTLSTKCIQGIKKRTDASYILRTCSAFTTDNLMCSAISLMPASIVSLLSTVNKIWKKVFHFIRLPKSKKTLSRHPGRSEERLHEVIFEELN